MICLETGSEFLTLLGTALRGQLGPVTCRPVNSSAIALQRLLVKIVERSTRRQALYGFIVIITSGCPVPVPVPVPPRHYRLSRPPLFRDHSNKEAAAPLHRHHHHCRRHGRFFLLQGHRLPPARLGHATAGA
jgi:hypothetical protein